MKQRSLFSILCIVFVCFGVASVSAQIVCTNNENFRPNGTYDASRRLILSSLPSIVTSQEGFFFNGSIGQEPNRVYAIGMCIPGSTSQDCSECIKTASDDLIKSCPNQTSAFTWLGDPTLCLVRYSNTSFLGSLDLNPPSSITNGANISSNPTEFTKTWEAFAVRMIDVASTAKSTPFLSNNHYTANSAALTAFQDMHALMQCTPDISSIDCKTCLRQSASEFNSQKRGARILRPSCYFRFELYGFSNTPFDSVTVVSPPPVAAPQHSDDQASAIDIDSKGISTGLVAAITVPTVATILLLLGLGFFLCRRRNYQRTEVESDSDISTTQSSQYDFKTIEAATNKFSKSNKLGEGGFGEVYKGTLSNGTEVAVKRLSKNSGQGTREFKNEAVLVSNSNIGIWLGFLDSVWQERKRF